MKKSILLLLVVSSFAVSAQKIKLTHGDLKILKGETSFAIKFTYDSMVVGTDTPEKTYLREKRKLWEEKEEGKGADFVKFWFTDRIDIYEPTFSENFAKYATVSVNDKEAKYLLIVKTKRTEGGWNGGVISHPGEIDGELWIVENNNTNTVVARIGFYEFIGKNSSGGDFEMTKRIESAYEKAGKHLGDYVRRKSK